MAGTLVVIEAPGKRATVTDLFRRAGIRDVEVLATAGHIGMNPERLRPTAIGPDYNELAYRLKPEREWIAAAIERAAGAARRVYLATDDDQEGDVIARDILRFCITRGEDRDKVLRVRLKALAPSEVKAAIAEAAPLDELAAAKGDARRVVDRLIGALSTAEAAVGRVQGSMLLMLAQQRPVVGTMTYRLQADDGKGDWIARAPLFAGQEIVEAGRVEGSAAVGRRELGTLAAAPMSHDQVLMAASLATGASIAAVDDAMQRLYEAGRMTYPRSRDRAVTPEAVRRVQATARCSGAGFDPARFCAVRAAGGDHSHEAPNAMVVDVPVNRDLALMGLDEQVLVLLTRRLIECGIACEVETPRMADLVDLPSELGTLRWSRVTPIGNRLWAEPCAEAGARSWTQEQALLHFSAHHGLGRPSTAVDHVNRFLSRDLVTQQFDITDKGATWLRAVRGVFRDQNASRLIEDYIADNKKPPSGMVADMLGMCGLTAVISAVSQQRGIEFDEAHEISGSDLS